MSTPNMSLDLDRLLAPIPGAIPAGEDLTFSTELDLIQEARRADDPSLDQGEWVTSLKEADWQAVINQCTTLLEKRSKDLRLCMWLTEALGKQNGFAGIAQGLQLTAQLSAHYWPHIYPAAEEGDQELRIGALTWLNSRLVQLFLDIPVTDSTGTAYTTQDHEAALQLSRMIANKPQEAAELAEGKLTLEQFDKSRRGTAKPFYQRLSRDADQCQAALNELEKVIDGHLGLEGPSFTNAKKSLQSARDLIERCARESGAILTATTTATNSAAPARTSATISPNGSAIEEREQALAKLNEVAEFFKRTEPHSPVAYLVEKAVRWGNMPLHAWLRSVVKDPVSLAHLEEMLGVSTAPEAPAGE